jgi:xanthine dehydrogenase accessory factor
MRAIPTSNAVATDWLAAGRRVVAATLVERIGSAPLDPGAEMLVDDDGRIEGTVTGGCVEGALVEEAGRILEGGEPRVVQYGISDEQAAGVGLMCGGTVRVFVHELDAEAREPLEETRREIEAGRPAALATLLDGPHAGTKLAVLPDRVVGGFGVTERLDRSVERDARGYLDQGVSLVRRYSESGEVMGTDLRVYIQSFSSPPTMVIFGAIDFSAAVARLARELGFEVTICDARAPFVQSPRFAETADIVIDWPDRFMEGTELGPRDVVLVFTHDPKFDQPALRSALASGAGYIGALGSRRTHEARLDRLRAAGAREEELERIHAPCGLDIGARTPGETAVSIVAEIVAVRARRGGESLRETTGPIHPPSEHEVSEPAP